MGHVDRDRYDSCRAFIEGRRSERADLRGSVDVRVEGETAVRREPYVVAPSQKRLPQESAPVQGVASEPMPRAALSQVPEDG